MKDKRYQEAKEETDRQIQQNIQTQNLIMEITGKLNGSIPLKPGETKEGLEQQLIIAQNSLRNGEDRLNSLRKELDKLRKELNGGFLSLLGLGKLGFTDKVVLIGGAVLVIWLLKG